ncbi:protein GLUTAMINE DUMPER 3 [Euphorbia lathyris]|uniref:protein GLUTAMINE DUMPER 3 n=1 Tax=Euphorbia lathyris TaxID=212925 RepID=UPI00331332E4
MAAREPFNVTAERSVVPTSAIGGVQRSPWHSPVPYLFGGLAAMLGLIAFALLILACSYWKLSGYLGNENDDGDRDLESGEGESKNGDAQKQPVVFEEKILVIMAGELKPTFLATPMSSRSSSFGDSSSTKSCCCNEKCVKLGENEVKLGENGEKLGESGENAPESSDQSP